MRIEEAYRILFTGAFAVLAVLIGLMLVRSVIGPRITDRILSVNMLSTMVICCIAIQSRLLGEGYLVDVALLYAMISFTTVMRMAVMYIPADLRRPWKKKRKKGDPGQSGRRKAHGRTDGWNG